MDGVIFDTERLARNLWREVFAAQGYNYSDEEYKKVIGRTMSVTEHILREDYGDKFPIDEMIEEQDSLWRRETANFIDLKPGVIELLDWLRKQEIPCAVGSSTNHEEVLSKLTVNGLRDYFVVVVGGDYVEQGKPAPDIFLKCLEYLELNAIDCLVIEDSRNGLKAACTAGIPALMIPDLISEDDIDSDIDFAVCDSLLELKEQLQQL
jgi:HAD superfamily hydrolase (TIGR01509 family)